MTATFHSLRDTRLPKAQKAVSLLENLARYDHTEQEAKDIVNAVSDAADDFAKVDLLNLLKFLKLRDHDHAQYEIRVYAQAMAQLAREVAPVSVAAWLDDV